MKALRSFADFIGIPAFFALAALIVADDRFQFATHPDPAQPGQMIAEAWFASTVRVLLAITCVSALLALASLLSGSNRSWSAWASTAIGILVTTALVLALRMPNPD